MGGSLFRDPESPRQADSLEQPPTGPPHRRGWMERRPRRAMAIVGTVALVVGLGIGAAAVDQQSELDASNADLERTKAALVSAREENERLDDDVAAAKDDAEKAREELAVATAKGELPDFVGRDVEDAEGHQDIATYSWDVRTRQRVSDRPPGTVLAQSPPAGRTLKAGRSVTLTVAKKPPPRPKQWVTIKSFSGNGEKRTDEFTIPEGPKARISYSFTGDTNAMMEMVPVNGGEFGGDLLFNEIGDFSDTTRIYESGEFYFEACCGAWHIDVQVFKRP